MYVVWIFKIELIIFEIDKKNMLERKTMLIFFFFYYYYFIITIIAKNNRNLLIEKCYICIIVIKARSPNSKLINQYFKICLKSQPIFHFRTSFNLVSVKLYLGKQTTPESWSKPRQVKSRNGFLRF